MKKPYEKPTLVRRGQLAAVTAVNGNGLVTSPGANPT